MVGRIFFGEVFDKWAWLALCRPQLSRTAMCKEAEGSKTVTKNEQELSKNPLKQERSNLSADKAGKCA